MPQRISMTQMNFDTPTMTSTPLILRHVTTQIAANEIDVVETMRPPCDVEPHDSRLGIGLITALAISIPLWFLIIVSLRAMMSP
jgi:hypothetical protein